MAGVHRITLITVVRRPLEALSWALVTPVRLPLLLERRTNNSRRRGGGVLVCVMLSTWAYTVERTGIMGWLLALRDMEVEAVGSR